MNTPVKDNRKRNSSAKSTTSETKRRNKLSIIPKNLLLAYTYFLNEKHTCKVIIGFDVETFEAEIILHRCNEVPTYISFKEWEFFFAKFKQLNEEEQKGLTINDDQLVDKLLENFVLKSTTKMMLNFTLNDYDNKVFTLFKNEHEQFLNIVEFLNIVMCYNSNASNNVREYFNKYMEKCRTKNLLQLTLDDYYIPMQMSHVHCNYSRLFFEIPLYCSMKLFQNVINDPSLIMHM